jgi:hypothetical protein
MSITITKSKTIESEDIVIQTPEAGKPQQQKI